MWDDVTDVTYSNDKRGLQSQIIQQQQQQIIQQQQQQCNAMQYNQTVNNNEVVVIMCGDYVWPWWWLVVVKVVKVMAIMVDIIIIHTSCTMHYSSLPKVGKGIRRSLRTWVRLTPSPGILSPAGEQTLHTIIVTHHNITNKQ